MKLAIIGTGKIVGDALIAMEVIETIEKQAIFARPGSVDKARAFAKKYDIPEVYTDYEELLTKTKADTVYIAVINSVHYSFAKAALFHGKNVILEKPFTGFYQEALELQKIARENQLFLIEAITPLHNDVFHVIKDNIDKIGDVRTVLLNFSQYSSQYDRYLAGEKLHYFSLDTCGGALFDINVYNIHYVAALFGEPKDVKYYPNIGYNGIDTSGTAVLAYDGFHAICTGTKDTDGSSHVHIQGEKGTICIEEKPNAPEKVTVVRLDESIKERVKDASGGMVRATITEEYQSPKRHHRMTREFEDFARMIDEKDYETADKLLEESVLVMKVLEEARVSAGIKF